MSLDGIVTRALVRELQSCVNARIHKIYQPTDNEMVWHIRGQGVNGRLLLSAHPSMPRLHWTEQAWENPAEPPMYCMLLRKYCEGGVIEAVRQVGLERIVQFDIRHRDELGDYSMKQVVLEIMGRHSNLILMDPASGIIHDGIRHVTPAISSYRVVLPGSTYAAPPSQDKRDPLSETESGFESARERSGADEGDASWLVGAYTGMSMLAANEIKHRAESAHRSLWSAFSELMQHIEAHRYEPTLVETPDGRTHFSAISLTHLQGNAAKYDSIHVCIDRYYQDKAVRDLVRQRTADLSRFLVNETAKNEKKLIKLEDSLKEAEDADQLRRIGELLTAQLHLLTKGDKKVDIVDFYDENQTTISVTLDPLLTPNENAQRYFRKYNKLKNSRTVIAEQMDAARAEIVYLASVLQGLETATPADIEEIREELVEQGYIRARGLKKGFRKKKKDRPALLCYTSSEGVPIYVGKNNTQNDYVTNKLGSPNDTWLHTKDIPGSHVLIRSQEFGDQTLREAATIAAYYSKAKQSSNVPIDYTRIRNVRKPNGAKPGFVTYDNQTTIYVNPDEALVQSLPSAIK